MYWPCMTAELKEYISQCETCSKYEVRQQKELLMSHEISDRPWQKVGTDLYTIDGQDYLIIVDFFSNIWAIDHLQDTKANTVIKKLKCHSARHGIPDIVISDNAPQFPCEKFSNFANEWGLEHRPGSPGHQKTAKQKQLLKRQNAFCERPKQPEETCILAQRSSHTESMGTSPAKRLLGRRCKTQLPTTKELLKPQSVRTEAVKKKIRAQQTRRAKYYNKRAQDLSPLEEGAVVRMRPFTLDKKVWEKAIVTKCLDERSCEAET